MSLTNHFVYRPPRRRAVGPAWPAFTSTRERAAIERCIARFKPGPAGAPRWGAGKGRRAAVSYVYPATPVLACGAGECRGSPSRMAAVLNKKCVSVVVHLAHA